ncbi:dihydrolipoamide acetyltransferase family protein [Streptomyces sp. FXJ1.4098]|uniref:dihydrolipoamide acetyltransferase family protein n=1 Tax=Streptomyces sp. NPDC020845 TaxID=3365096 RepID=UPI0029949E30|nr:dihydrolipoamide acetyltransferase family protein [Streptomyces sp. FXJ1.4098]
MAEVREFTLPDLGEGLTGAEIVRWLVEVGEVVAVDQPVVEVETAKALVDVPCPYGGVVTARFGEEGTELPVGAPLLTVAVPTGEGGTQAVGGGASAVGGGSSAVDGRAPAAEGGSGNVLVGYGTSAPSARRRRVRPAPPVPASGPVGGVGGGVAEGLAGGLASTTTSGPVAASSPAAAANPVAAHPVPPAPGSGPEANGAARPATGPVSVISPLVRRLAREHGLDLRELRGSGPDGLILRADVERAAQAVQAAEAARTAQAVQAAPAPAAVAAGASRTGPREADGTRVVVRGVRGAEKLARSRREIPDATCWVDADATELLAARAAMNAAGPKISLLALLARICTAALARHPELNATVSEGEITRRSDVHLGFAAQTDRGLVVPVVHDAHARDTAGLSAELTRLTEAARSGTLVPAELTGGTFTLNNYGVFGVDGSTPIINHPEAAMLGVGRIAAKPWVHQDQLAIRQVVQLSLTFDHRVCDGGIAGGFLRYVADCVEHPAVLLRSV